MCRPTLQPFLDSTTPCGEARYVVVGAPLDSTASYRGGTRFAPNAIRHASQYMETFSLRTGLDLEDISLADIGDIRVSEDVRASLQNIGDIVSQASLSGRVPVVLGGEHTVTLGALRALRPDLLVDFDAHLDLRDRLMGLDLSHGTFMRRALEELDFRLIVLGCRAISKEEIEYAEKNADRVRLVTAPDLLKGGPDEGVKAVKDWLGSSASAYVSIDMDVVDPACAPAVGNPSPGGIGVVQLLDVISGTANGRFIGFDITEVTPLYDSGLTATQAAYIVLETIYCIEAAHRRSRW